MKIDIVEKTEFNKLVEVWEKSVRATHHFLDEKDIEHFKPLILNEYLHLVDLRCVRNAAGEIIGFIGVHENKVEMLFIEPEARGKGIGKQLLEYAKDELGTTKVDVNEDNHQAIGFYERMGFATVSRSELDSSGKPYPILSMELRVPKKVGTAK
jgi:putative acetyltransferase